MYKIIAKISSIACMYGVSTALSCTVQSNNTWLVCMIIIV